MKNIIKNKIEKYGTKHVSRHIIKKCPELYQEILNITSTFNNISLTERLYIIMYGANEKKCICGNDKKFKSISKGYLNFCSTKCAANSNITQNKTKKTMLKKYGVENMFENKEYIKQIMINKYGVDNIFKNKEYIKQKTKEKYGVESCMQIKSVQNKLKKTMLNKYGVEHPFQIKRVKKELSNKSINRMYDKIMLFKDVMPLFNKKDYIGSYVDYEWLCKKCNNKFISSLPNGLKPICPICNPITTSKFQTEIITFISSITTDTIVTNNRKIIHPYEIDCYIPEKKIGFEFNGNYWHSELHGKSRIYHVTKTNMCNENKIRLIQIFEDEWIHKKNIVKSRLKHILGKTKYKIYGRKCVIKEISPSLKNKFLNKYHIQGEDKSKIKLGAFYKNRLIAVMTFGQLRKALGHTTCENKWELIRYATISNFNCIGVAGKLLKYFEKNIKPLQIISYADKRWSMGELYFKLKFNLHHVSKPNYWYMKDYRSRLHRFNFRKNVLNNKLKKYDSTLSEWQNMQNNGWNRIWDCGNYCFIKNLSLNKTV